MRKIVLIWRESVYKNHFKCNQCGRKLADEDGTPIRKTMVSDRFAHGFMKCAYCHNVVCKMETGDYPDSIYGLQGEYKERENNAGRNDI